MRIVFSHPDEVWRQNIQRFVGHELTITVHTQSFDAEVILPATAGYVFAYLNPASDSLNNLHRLLGLHNHVSTMDNFKAHSKAFQRFMRMWNNHPYLGWTIPDNDFRYWYYSTSRGLFSDKSRFAKAVRRFIPSNKKNDRLLALVSEYLGELYTFYDISRYKVRFLPAEYPYRKMIVNSCMVGKPYAISFYEGMYNAGIVQSAVLERNGQELARTLIWSLPQGKFHDRIYAVSVLYQEVFEQKLNAMGIKHIRSANKVLIRVPEQLKDDASKVYFDSLHRMWDGQDLLLVSRDLLMIGG